MERTGVFGPGKLAEDAVAEEFGVDPSLASMETPFILSTAAAIDVEPAAFVPRTPATTELSTSARLLDVSVALVVLVLVAPLMLFCALAVMLTSRGPVLFRHTRIGRNGREFTCLKFRTMVDRADVAIEQVCRDDSHSLEQWLALHKLLRDPRITRLGRFMRRYSLDELPQLFNVLAGDMSIVGPRPIVADEIYRYGAHFTDYCSVNPGITGLWQVSGLHALPYSERVRLDAEYARSKSVGLDLLILMRTVPVVLLGQNM